ncbi:MAG TPA: hypothetical protein VEB60_01550, partial [Candidatus Paceibacterota bacterium]|nr:hypothetical protein [Candidatus Paceibacterota bacterium]
TTNSPAGYSLAIKASTDPALTATEGSFANYTPAGTADYVWSIPETSSEFGMSPEGSDIVAAFRDNGAQCGVGNLDTEDRCWGPVQTTDTTISGTGVGIHPAGAATDVRFRAEIGSARSSPQKPGSYQAELTVTAVAF